MTPMTLYVASMSTPSRAVLLVVRNLSIDIEVGTNFTIKQLNLLAGEHRRSEFTKINPRCCVPTLVDNDGHNDFILWESKAIMIYLAEKCQRFGHSLYPKCIKTRAVIHQRLFHDASELYVRILDIANLAFSGVNPMITVQHKENLKKALQILESFLEGHDYMTGNSITICDFAYFASVCTLVHFGYAISKFPCISQWYQRMKKYEGIKECDEGAQEFGEMIKGKLGNSFND
ncbi:hypothetical protein ACKWTF_000196 [Chironomus riparius]